jgi:hypothetical protein
MIQEKKENGRTERDWTVIQGTSGIGFGLGFTVG